MLFFAEMWERFSFYGMRALLVFYLTKHFLFDDATATGIYATYGALVYLAPVFGGLLADRYLGFRRSIVLGAVLLCLGHFGMAFEGGVAEGGAARVTDGQVIRDGAALQVLYASLALIIVGVGFLKPNISGIVGQLYKADDPRRDAGFTLFYMGINVGAFVAAIVCGYLGETFGWAYGFGVAGLGMLTGLVTFLRGGKALTGLGAPAEPERLAKPVFGMRFEHWIYVGALLGVGAAWWLVQSREVVGTLLTGTSLVVVFGVVVFVTLRCEREERDRTLLVLLLTAVSVLFWALFEQAGSSMNLFADRGVDRSVFGVTVAASQLQSLNPAFIIVFAPVLSWLWTRSAKAGREPSTAAKFALALLQVGAGFAALVYGIGQAVDGVVALGWLVLAYLLHTTGELCLSPVGLSMVTRLSVPRMVGLMMGVWFLSASLAHYIAGAIAAMATGSPAGELEGYASAFELVALVAIVAGAALLLVSPLLRRLTHS